MIKQFIISSSLMLAATTICAPKPPSFNPAWITAKPEVLTYQSKAKEGDGLYQVGGASPRNSDRAAGHWENHGVDAGIRKADLPLEVGLIMRRGGSRSVPQIYI